ncbi:MAG: putative lipoic acid-binding regulatory protein [Planctomycetota bacterium]|jgi:putative lipoic acid-binding regulatory protein
MPPTPEPDKLPSKELLEQRHAFPCPYIFKVIGTADEGFEARVTACVQRELRTNVQPPSSVRETKGGRHQSVTVEPTCPDADSVLRLYAELRKVEGVMFLF